ncbi:MAG: hypothetical protein JSU82_03035 [Rhodospirillales bacterium]|nr:MAG: hypothetical protein JSU82_03035 [Rhodospirillales bacterium]
MPKRKEKRPTFRRVARLAHLMILLVAVALSVSLGYEGGDVVMSKAHAVGNGNGNGGTGNGKGRGDTNGRGGQSASHADNGARGSSHSNGAADRGSLNASRAAGAGLAHASDRSPVGALRDYMGSMVDYAAAVDDLMEAERAKQEYLDGLPPGQSPDEETLGDLDQAIVEAADAVDDALESAAESLADAANKDARITEAVVEDLNAELDGKLEGFLDPDGHIADSVKDLVDELADL